MAELGAHTRRRLEAIADDALRRAGALGVVPTPLDAVAAAAGVHVEPVAALAADRPLLGALWFEERTLFLERRQSAARRRFTQAHELMHALCPWHHATLLHTDTEAELFGPVKDALEAEANAGASLLIFGGSAFRRRAAAPASIDAARELAALHGASVHATLHRCVEAASGPCALLIAGRYPLRDGSLPVWRSVESPAFRRRHGRARELFAAGLQAGSPLRALAERARSSSEPPATTVRVRGATVRAEAHDNRHVVLVLLVSGACAPRPGG
jgi:hypothetical protein